MRNAKFYRSHKMCSLGVLFLLFFKLFFFFVACLVLMCEVVVSTKRNTVVCAYLLTVTACGDFTTIDSLMPTRRHMHTRQFGGDLVRCFSVCCGCCCCGMGVCTVNSDADGSATVRLNCVLQMKSLEHKWTGCGGRLFIQYYLCDFVTADAHKHE